jgi:hypothetical protein
LVEGDEEVSVVSPRRWAGTTAVMAAAAWMLSALGPGLAELHAALADPQGLVDRSGPDGLVLVLVPVLAWLCWAWGAVGLLLTAVSTVPGAAGRLAGWLLGRVLPGSARRAAALALGLGLGTVAPIALLPVGHPLVASAAAEEVGAADGPVLLDRPTAPASDVVPDWPTGPAGPPGVPPDWPHVAPGEHVVVRGECLWDIARDRLQQQAHGAPVTAAEVARATRDWWQANASVIGPDPDLLLPGQVLRPPG